MHLEYIKLGLTVCEVGIFNMLMLSSSCFNYLIFVNFKHLHAIPQNTYLTFLKQLLYVTQNLHA